MVQMERPEHILFLHSFSFKNIPNIPDPLKVLDQIKQEFPKVEVSLFKTEQSKDVPKELWAKATVIITLFVLPEKLEDIPNVHLVHLISAGSDHISSHPLMTSPDAKHITVTTSSGIHGPPVGEWVLMATLALTKHYNKMHDWQKEAHWGPKDLWFRTSGDWVGKNVGILGYGSIGRHVGRIFSALGANIHAFTHTARDTPESKKDNGYIIPNTGDPSGTIPTKWFSSTQQDGNGLSSFLTSNLHILILCIPLTKSTTSLLTIREFQLLQSSTPWPKNPLCLPLSTDSDEPSAPGAMVVNISRGKIINSDHLISALKHGTILGAALDVTDPEPLDPSSELWKMDNVIISPHISALGYEYMGRSLDVLRVNFHRLRDGKDLINVVHKGRGY